jgi:hypothetical protein
MDTKTRIEAMKTELDGYLARGEKDRAAHVSEILSEMGVTYPAEPKAETTAKRAKSPASKSAKSKSAKSKSASTKKGKA